MAQAHRQKNGRGQTRYLGCGLGEYVLRGSHRKPRLKARERLHVRQQRPHLRGPSGGHERI